MPSFAQAGTCAPSGRFALERVLFALAATLTLASAALAAAVSTWLVVVTAFEGVDQLLLASVGGCLAALTLSRAFGLESLAGQRGLR